MEEKYTKLDPELTKISLYYIKLWEQADWEARVRAIREGDRP